MSAAFRQYASSPNLATGKHAAEARPKFRARGGRNRRGATILEMSFVLLIFLTLTLGMLDLGVGVFRYHIISQAARHGARRAIVHGEFASALGSWGPASINVAASTSGVPIVDGGDDGLQSMLVGCDLNATTIQVDWPSGSNELEEPVRVTVTTSYTPVFSFIFPDGAVTLSASSTMPIAH